MEGFLDADHAPLNRYRLSFTGINNGQPIVILSISGMEEELDKTELPDRTMRSGGRTKPVEFTVKIPMHQANVEPELERWRKEATYKSPIFFASNGVDAGYRKKGVFEVLKATGAVAATYDIANAFPYKRTLPTFELKNEGEMAESEWMFVCDAFTRV